MYRLQHASASAPRKSKTIAERLKSLFHTLGEVTSMLWSGRWQDRMRRAKNKSSSGKFVLRISSPIAPCPFPYYADYRETLEQEQQPTVFSNAEKIDCFQAIVPRYDSETKEVYIPCHEWDAQNPAERYASVTDLCAHIGDQLPIQVVKLIARDILRSLDNLHCTRGAVHGNITPHIILLSPTDLRSLISQLRAETQPSFQPSELIVGLPFGRDPFATPDTTSAVFMLSDVEDNYPRPEYPDCEALLSPEMLLEGKCDIGIDMWALGCILFELLTGEALFDPSFQTKELNITKEESHFIQMIELFGTMPLDVIRSGKSSYKWFTEDGSMRIQTSYYPIALQHVLGRHIAKDNVPGTAKFLEKLLKLRPDDRARPRDMIDDPWFSE